MQAPERRLRTEGQHELKRLQSILSPRDIFNEGGTAVRPLKVSTKIKRLPQELNN